MTVRFKCRSEYQKSFGASRSRTTSPRCGAPSAGLRSDQMGISREPGLQRRKRLGHGGLTQSCSSLLRPLDPERPLAEPAPPAPPAAASRSGSAHRKERKPPTPPGAPTEPGSAADPGPPAGPRPAADPGPHIMSSSSPAKLRPSRTDSQPRLSRPVTAAPRGKQPSTTEALYSSSRSVPPFKKHPVPMETEYRRSFKGLAPPTRPRLLKHLEHQRVPLFHTHMTNKKRKEESVKKPRPDHDVPAPCGEDATPPPLPPPPGLRMWTEYQSSFPSPLCRIVEEGGASDLHAPQVVALRRQASLYRRRAWGTHFSRAHLSQLRSEHNALWEPTDSTASGAPSPRRSSDLTSCVEPLVLHSSSSRRSSETPPEKNKEEQQQEEEEEEEDEEGRLPTPRLKLFPAQRTHHDLTTPAAGGALLVGKSSEESEERQAKRCASAVSMTAGAESAAHRPTRHKEAWPENNPACPPTTSSSPKRTPVASPPSKPIRTKQTPAPAVAPPPHCIQGALRHADFQHNGELGLRLREPRRSGGADGGSEDDRLSAMSWRSAASCSMASAVLERAQKRRDSFWGKR